MRKPHFKNDAGKFLTFKCQLSFRERIVWANSNKCLLMLFSKCPNDFFLLLKTAAWPRGCNSVKFVPVVMGSPSNH